MASFEQLVFEIIARDRNASASFDRVRKSIDQTSNSIDKNTKSLQQNQQAQKSWTGAAIGLGAAFGAMLSPLTAATTGVAAFSALAVPSIAKITTALTGPGGLAKAWGSLDNNQRLAANSVLDLKTQYMGLAKAMEPQVFQVFNSTLRLTQSVLGPVAQLAAQAGKGIENLVAGFTVNSGIQQFFRFMSTIAAPAITLLGQDITAITHAVFALLESFGGIGLAELKLFTTALTGLANAIAFLAEHTGPLAGVALAIGGVALALAKLQLLSGVLKLTGITAITEQLVGFTAATKGATLAEKAMLATTTALDAITPWGWVILGTAAFGFLADKIVTAKTSLQDFVDEQAKTSQATGLNIAGYQKLADTLGKAASGQTDLNGQFFRGREEQNGNIQVTQALTAAQQKSLQVVANLRNDFSVLGSQYGLTTAEAKDLIIKSGALNDILAANGRITPVAAEKIRAWARQEQTATGLTNATAIAVQSLTDAMAKNVTTVLTLQGDDLAWQSAMQQATAQLKSNSAGLEGNSKNAIANKQAVLAATNAVVSFATEQIKSKANLSGASGEIAAQIKFLQGLHDKSGFAAQEIKVLVGILRQIKSERATIRVSGTGSYSITASSPIKGPHPGGPAAAGTLVSGGIAGRDSVPILAMPGELVVPTKMVQAGAVDHLRGSIPGFAAGGVVGSYRDGVPGLSGFVARETAATLKAIENATAAAAFAAIQAARRTATFGGAGGPGGGAPSANAALARRMMPAWASGAAWSAWNYVAMRESGWSQFAENPTSGAYGIPQALPPTKLPFAGQKAGGSNPAAQIGWMIGYMSARYGGPIGAAAWEASHGWYDQGGWLKPGWTMAYNGTGRPEQVIPSRGRSGRIVLEVHAGTGPVDRFVAEIIKRYVRVSGGGDVQVALGTSY